MVFVRSYRMLGWLGQVGSVPNPTKRGHVNLRAPEKELHVFGCELLQRFTLVLVDRAPNQVGLLLLELHDPGLDRIFDGKPSDHTGPLLSNPMTAIRALPLGCWVPPPAQGVLAQEGVGRQCLSDATYGSTINTREASVKLRATPPAFKETRKTSTSALFMKCSMDFCRCAGVIVPSSMTVLNPA